MVNTIGHVVEAAGDTPVIADGDNGYGDVSSVAKLVNAYEEAGAQCIQIEDQVSPKRCGHMDNKEVVDLDEAVSKIATSVQSRKSEDFLIMARTDSRATHGLNEALRRGEAFLKAGADVLFIEAPASIEEMEIVKKEFPETVLVANMVEEGKTPVLKVSELSEMGYQIVLRPISGLLAVVKTLKQSYSALLNDDQDAIHAISRLTFQEYNKVIKLSDYS
jgi:2-methylisocitrate lyase-like PEP mutase family enzyme